MNKKSENIKAVVFDVFGTLVCQTGERMHPYRLFTAEKNKTQMASDISHVTLMTRNISGPVWLEELGLGHLVPKFNRLLETDISGLRLFSDVKETFSMVRSAGLKIAVCSNLAHAYGATVMNFFPDVDAHILSYEIGEVKPNAPIFKAVCESLQVPPDEILFVGDSQRCDFEGAKNYGMHCFWLNRPTVTLLDAIGMVAKK